MRFILILILLLPSAALAREVFLIAGQSNSANHGDRRQSPYDRRVFTFDYGTGLWRFGADPQPNATGDGGSPWPAFGSKLARDLNADIGLVSVGVGGTAVSEWLPDTGAHYWRLQAALQALGPGVRIRAVLWHQGESDVQATTTAEEYAQRLATIIGRFNSEAGYPIPWVVAGVSYVNFDRIGKQEHARMAEIRRGQALLWSTGEALRGPTTDDLVGRSWRWDGIHFNERGLREHGRRWAVAVERLLYRKGD